MNHTDPKSRPTPPEAKVVILTDGERELLSMIRTGNYETITVRSDSGRIEMLEAVENVSERRMIDILQDEEYQDVTVKRRDGKDVLIVRTIKRKL